MKDQHNLVLAHNGNKNATCLEPLSVLFDRTESSFDCCRWDSLQSPSAQLFQP
jgi:hypothetical protein